MFLIFGAEDIVGGSCCEDGSRSNCTSDEPVVLVADVIQDGRVENGHEAGQGGGMERRGLSALSETGEGVANSVAVLFSPTQWAHSRIRNGLLVDNQVTAL